ncbi:hypothetical protein MC885_009509 [Smutsia gigantea]|nr:hypothetical protein MC885_009509 [Smutsia gigantea]
MAEYDLPATVDFIVEKTGQEQLYYVGHSQGTMITFTAFSTIPELAKRIKILFALAPIITVKYTQNPLKKLTDLSRNIVKMLLGDRMFYSHACFDQLIARKVCNRKLFHYICSNFLFTVNRFDPKNLNMSRLDVYLAQIPVGTSAQNIQHRAQAANSGLKVYREKQTEHKLPQDNTLKEQEVGWDSRLQMPCHLAPITPSRETAHYLRTEALMVPPQLPAMCRHSAQSWGHRGTSPVTKRDVTGRWALQSLAESLDKELCFPQI